MQTKSTRMQILHYRTTNQKGQRHQGAIRHQKVGAGAGKPEIPGDTKNHPIVQDQADTGGLDQVVALILQQGTFRTYQERHGGRNPRRTVEWALALVLVLVRPEPLDPKAPPLVQHQWIQDKTQDVTILHFKLKKQ